MLWIAKLRRGCEGSDFYEIKQEKTKKSLFYLLPSEHNYPPTRNEDRVVKRLLAFFLKKILVTNYFSFLFFFSCGVNKTASDYVFYFFFIFQIKKSLTYGPELRDRSSGWVPIKNKKKRGRKVTKSLKS